MRHLLLLSVLLLSASWAAAQNYPSQGSQTKPSTSGTEMSLQGCLGGSNGSYTLADKNGNSFQLTGDTAKLSEHVGHEVKVTGTPSSASPSPSAGASSGAMGQASSSSQQAIEVSSVKHISKTCKSGGTSH
jgi:hypothetical protein